MALSTGPKTATENEQTPPRFTKSPPLQSHARTHTSYPRRTSYAPGFPSFRAPPSPVAPLPEPHHATTVTTEETVTTPSEGGKGTGAPVNSRA